MQTYGCGSPAADASSIDSFMQRTVFASASANVSAGGGFLRPPVTVDSGQLNMSPPNSQRRSDPSRTSDHLRSSARTSSLIGAYDERKPPLRRLNISSIVNVMP